MNELLQQIKADLLSRHLLPLLAVAGVALAGALAYVALDAGSSSKPPAPTPVASLPKGLPVAIAPPNTTSAAASETPAGVQYQTQGSARNPFTPLPGTQVASAAGTSASSTSAKGASTSSGAPGGSGSSSTQAGSTTAPSSTTPAPVPSHGSPSPTLKTETLSFYSVSALFGLAPVKPGEQPTLTPYEDMKRFEPLPAPKVPLIVFVGVDDSKKTQRAAFALIVPPILRGQGVCFPSDTHCQAIELAAGKSEELEYVKPSGETVAFELKVVKIAKRSASAGAAQAKALHVSKQGRRALRKAGLTAIR